MKTFSKNYTYIILFFILIITTEAKSQEIKVNFGFRDSLKSEILQEQRNILIHLPENYKNTNKNYPVLYCLDGSELNFVFIVSATHRLTYWDKITPEMIIVAVENTNRARDMWPTNGKYYPKKYKAGANDFIQFFEKELIPYIDSNYRSTQEKILYGQSLSGMFALYTFVARPYLFDSYIVSSGAFPGCEDYFIELYQDSFRKKEAYKDKKLFITNGLLDPLDPKGIMHQQMLDFTNTINSELANQVRIKYKTYETEGHVPFHSLYDGLKFIYKSDK